MSAGVAVESSCDTATQEVFVGPTQDLENLLLPFLVNKVEPVSNLGFASKLVEKVVVNQLMDYLTII